MKILEEALRLINEFGWVQGRYGSEEVGGYCAFGAITEAYMNTGGVGDGRRAEREEALKRTDAYVQARGLYLNADNYSCIGASTIGFNDDPSTTEADVREMFESLVRDS